MFIIVILGILGLLIAAAVLAVRYLRIHAKALSRKEFETEAARQTARIQYRDPVITCDYCGTRIDTSVYDTCPNCGASYDTDEEWKARHRVDDRWAEVSADRFVGKKLREAKEQSAATGKKLKRTAAVLGILAVVLIAAAIAALTAVDDRRFEENDVLNEYSFQHYEKTSWGVDGDGVIVDAEGVTVTLTGFYQQRDDWETRLCAEYQIENHSGRAVSVRFELAGANGYAPENGLGFQYGWYRNGSTVTKYDELYALDDSVVGELVFCGIRICDDENCLYEGEGAVRLTTTADGVPRHTLPNGTVLYEDRGVTVLDAGMTRHGETLWIQNDSDYDYTVTTSDFRINGKEVGTIGFYEAALPAHYVFCSDGISPYGGDVEERTAEDTVELSVRFTCDRDPSADFSTGFLTLPGL